MFFSSLGQFLKKLNIFCKTVVSLENFKSEYKFYLGENKFHLEKVVNSLKRVLWQNLLAETFANTLKKVFMEHEKENVDNC